jgi:IMP cyclohydrolase
MVAFQTIVYDYKNRNYDTAYIATIDKREFFVKIDRIDNYNNIYVRDENGLLVIPLKNCTVFRIITNKDIFTNQTKLAEFLGKKKLELKKVVE